MPSSRQEAAAAANRRSECRCLRQSSGIPFGWQALEKAGGTYADYGKMKPGPRLGQALCGPDGGAGASTQGKHRAHKAWNLRS